MRLEQNSSQTKIAETIVLASEEKLNVAPPYVVMPLTKTSGIILQGKTTRAFLTVLKRSGLDVHLA